MSLPSFHEVNLRRMKRYTNAILIWSQLMKEEKYDRLLHLVDRINVYLKVNKMHITLN